jgi:hypothetical protein
VSSNRTLRHTYPHRKFKQSFFRPATNEFQTRKVHTELAKAYAERVEKLTSNNKQLASDNKKLSGDVASTRTRQTEMEKKNTR